MRETLMSQPALLLWIAAPELIVALAVAYAFKHGGRAEKWGVASLAISWTVYSFILIVTGHEAGLSKYILIETCNSVFFLLLAFWSGEMWTGLILFPQAAMLGALGLQMNNLEPGLRSGLNLVNNGTSLITVAIVLGSVFTSRHRLLFRKLQVQHRQAAFRNYIDAQSALPGPCQIDLDYEAEEAGLLGWLLRVSPEVNAPPAR
jgi:hypothetical protein